VVPFNSQCTLHFVLWCSSTGISISVVAFNCDKRALHLVLWCSSTGIPVSVAAPELKLPAFMPASVAFYSVVSHKPLCVLLCAGGIVVCWGVLERVGAGGIDKKDSFCTLHNF